MSNYYSSSSSALTPTPIALDNGGFAINWPGHQVTYSAAGSPVSQTSTTASDTMIGTDGADTLTGGGGADIILAGAGNDTAIINASNISNLTTAGKLIDGGAGIDTLKIGADASTLDLSKSAVQANVQNFEKIDLGADAVANTVILNATAVQRLATQNLNGSSGNKQLIIDGTSSDVVKLSGQYDNGILAGYWTQSTTTPTRTVGGVTYKVYTISGLSGVEVLVNNAITTANTDMAYQMASGDIVTVPSNSVVVGDLEATDTNGPNSSAGGSGDGSQWASSVSSNTSDTTPLVKGILSQALTGTQVLHLYRTDVTAGGAPVEIAANVATTGTLSGTNWEFQDSGLTAGHQYTYTAKIMDGSTTVDTSNTYTINEAVAALPTNSSVSLSLSIATDVDNNTWVNSSEIGSSNTFTARATFDNTKVKAGDKITFHATNDGSALTDVVITLTASDVAAGFVTTNFAKPLDGKTQVVNASYTDSFGNAAPDAKPQDSATLDVTTPTISLTDTAVTYSSGVVSVSGVPTLKSTETATITITLSEAPASGTLTAADLVSSAGGTIGTVTATADPKVFTVQYTAPANGQGTDVITVADHVFTDAAGNYNLDTYVSGATSPLIYQANNQVSIAYDTAAPTQTVTLSSMTKDSGSANHDWTTSDGSAGRLLSGFISAPLGAGEVVKVYANGTYLGDATVAANGTTWEYTDTTGYSANWTYSAKVVDAVGNAGAAISQLVTLDATEAAPVITAVTDSASASIANAGTTTNALSTVSGTGAVGDTIYLYDNTGTNLVGTTTVASNGTWSISGLASNANVGEGSNTFSARQVDALGNQSVMSNLWTVTAKGGNLVANGDFTAGNTGFTTSLVSNSVPISGGTDQYTVTTTSNIGSTGYANGGGFINSSNSVTTTDSPLASYAYGTWTKRYVGQSQAAYTGIASGNPDGSMTGNVLVGQVSSPSSTTIWSEVVSVTAGKTYTFKFDYSNFDFQGTEMGVTIDGAYIQMVTNDHEAGHFTATYIAPTSKNITLSLSGAQGTLTSFHGDFVLDNFVFAPVAETSDGSLVAGGSAPFTTGVDGSSTAITYTGGVADMLAGNDVLNIGTNAQTLLSISTNLIDGGAGIDTLKLAAGTSLNLAALTVNQTVTPIQEVEVIQMQGSSSVLTMTANDVLSLGGAASTMGPTYTFSSTTQGSGATGSTSSTGKVQFVVHGQTGDTLNLNALANDGVSGTGVNAGVLGNSSLAGTWDYKGQVTLTDAQGTSHTYKVYDHSTTGAQVLADVNVTVNTLSPITISAISTDSGTSSTDFVTNDPTLVYTGTVPVLANGEKVHVQIWNAAHTAVVYEDDATLNGTNWTLDKTATTLAAGNYTIVAMIEDSSGNPVASYGALGTATHSLTVDTTTPTVAVTQSGTGNTRTVTFTLSEASTTFDASDVDVTNGTLSNFAADTSTGTATTGYTRYTATFTAAANTSGTATVGVLNSKFTDIAGNANLDTYAASPSAPVVNDGNNQVSFTVDTVKPTVSVSTAKTAFDSATTATIYFDFSEPISTTEFVMADIYKSGTGTLSNLVPDTSTGNSSTGYTRYQVTYTPASGTPSEADNTIIGVAAGKFADAAGNLNADTYNSTPAAGEVYEANNQTSVMFGTVPIGGTGAQTRFGFDVHGIGDVNGDGLEDFAVADRGVNAGDWGAPSLISAKSYVIFGATDLDLGNFNTTTLSTPGNGKGFVISGSTASYNSYDAALNTSAAGDVNGDGLMDLAVFDRTTGQSYIVYGKTDTNSVTLVSTGLASSVGYKFTNPWAATVQGIGDINGDGYAEQYVELTYPWTVFGYIKYGTATPGNFTIPTAHTGSSTDGFFIHGGADATNAGGGRFTNFLSTYANHGDFNGDGYEDFVILDGNWTGTANYSLDVVWGGPTLQTKVVTAWNGALSNLATSGNGAGFQVQGLITAGNSFSPAGIKTGDINGDGLTDMVLYNMANNDTYSNLNSNADYVVFGKADSNTVNITDLAAGNGGFKIFDSRLSATVNQGSVGDIDIIGDFNGDGLADMVVSDRNSFVGQQNPMTWQGGAAYVVYGKTSGSSIDLASLTVAGGTTDGFLIDIADKDNAYNGSYPNTTTVYGNSVAGGGDLNGDGFADLIVSAYMKDSSTGTIDTGAVYVVYGGAGAAGTSAVFQAGNGDLIGTTGIDNLVGTSGNNQIVAGAGDDTLTGNGGADVLYGGAGNDTIILNASNVAAFANTTNLSQAVMKVDGGTGIDTLKLAGSGITLDLTQITKVDLSNVEVIDMTGSGANTLKLAIADVLERGQHNTFNVDTSAVDTKVQLMITGDANTVVHLTDIANWSQPVSNNTYSYGGHTYNVYNDAGAQLLVDQLIVNAGHFTA